MSDVAENTSLSAPVLPPPRGSVGATNLGHWSLWWHGTCGQSPPHNQGRESWGHSGKAGGARRGARGHHPSGAGGRVGMVMASQDGLCQPGERGGDLGSWPVGRQEP